MLLFFSISGFLLSFLIIYFNARKFRSSIYLALFFLLESLYLLIFHAVVYSKFTILIAILFVNTGFLYYLIGPVLYFYFRSIFNDDSRLKRKDTIHFIPAIIYFVTSLPYIFSEWSHKIAIAQLLADDYLNLKSLKPTILYEILPVSFLYIAPPAIALIYSIVASFLLFRWNRQGKTKMVLHHQKYFIRWLMVLLIIVSLTLVSHIAPMIVAYSERKIELFFSLKVLMNISAAGLTGLLISILFFPQILYGLPFIPEDLRKNEKENADEKQVEKNTESLNQKADFEEVYLKQIGDKSDLYMRDHQMYIQQDCNLALFAKMLNIPAHHLAYYFREVRKQPFNTYRNEWRIEHAIHILNVGSHKDLTLEAVGRLSGFTSRNTFFTAFKKSKGITPGEFASSLKSENNLS